MLLTQISWVLSVNFNFELKEEQILDIGKCYIFAKMILIWIQFKS